MKTLGRWQCSLTKVQFRLVWQCFDTIMVLIGNDDMSVMKMKM